MIGRFFKGLLIFILGMIFGIIALFGGLYVAATQVKMGDIVGLIGYQDAIGDELKELSLVDTAKKVANPSATIGTYFEWLPVLEDTVNGFVNEGELGKYVNVNLDELKSSTVNNIGDNLGKALSIIVSLNTLKETFGFELPNMPIFNVGDDGYEDYVKISSTTEITNIYYKDKLSKIYYKSGESYVNAYKEDGSLAAGAEAPLYYKGYLTDVPVTDAITGLSNVLNFEKFTFGDLKNKFGIDLFAGAEDSVFSQIISETDTLNGVVGSIESNINDLTLGDFIDFDTVDFKGIITAETQIGSLRGADDYTPLDLEENIYKQTLETLGLDFSSDALMSKVLLTTDTIGGLVGAQGYTKIDVTERINALTLQDLGLDFSSDALMSKVFKPTDTVESLKGDTINTRINDLTLSDLGFSVTGIASKVISADDTIGSLKDCSKINDAINNLTIDDLGVSVDGVAGKVIYKTDSIATLKASGTISGRINNLAIGELVSDSDDALLKALKKKGATVGNLSEKIGELTFTDVYTSAKVFVSSTETTKTASNYMSFTKNGDNYVQAAAGDYYISSDAGIWLMLLYKKTGTYGSFTYTFNDMKLLEFGNSVSGDLTSNFSSCTMQELYEVGIIETAPKAAIASYTFGDVIATLNAI